MFFETICIRIPKTHGRIIIRNLSYNSHSYNKINTNIINGGFLCTSGNVEGPSFETRISMILFQVVKDFQASVRAAGSSNISYVDRPIRCKFECLRISQCNYPNHMTRQSGRTYNFDR